MIIVKHSMVFLFAGEIMKIMITGTDKRSLIIKEILHKKLDCEIYAYSGTVSDGTSVIILPTPVTTDGINLNFTDSENKNISHLLNSADKNTLIIGAGFSHNRVYDLCTRDDFSIENAVPTAEGAISIAINETDSTLYDSKILITGFGRVARILLDRLSAFSKNITVAARDSGNRAEINALNMTAIDIKDIKNQIDTFDIVFNTIPFCIFDSDILSLARKDTLFIELASKKAGFDTDAVNELPNFVNATGLPGKFAPLSAGKIMAETIITLLYEKDILRR